MSSKVSSVNSAAKTLRLGFLWWCALASQGAGFRPVLPLMQQTHARPDAGAGSRSHVLPAPSHPAKSPPSAAGGKELGPTRACIPAPGSRCRSDCVSRDWRPPGGHGNGKHKASLLSTFNGQNTAA